MAGGVRAGESVTSVLLRGAEGTASSRAEQLFSPGEREGDEVLQQCERGQSCGVRYQNVKKKWDFIKDRA